MAMLPTMLANVRRVGWSAEQAARHLGVSVSSYREIEAGERSPDWETFDPDQQDVRLAADVRQLNPP